MTFPKFSILVALTLSTSLAFGQYNGVINIDSSGLPDGYFTSKLAVCQKALMGAENFIKTHIGGEFLSRIWMDAGGTRGPGKSRLDGPPHNTRLQLRYYVIDGTDTIGYFQILVDGSGNPMKYTHDHDLYNRIELLAGIRRHFENKFQFSYAQALESGKQKGVLIKPYLTCDYRFEFNSKKGKCDTSGTVKYYWTFKQIENSGEHRTVLELSAESGEIIIRQ